MKRRSFLTAGAAAAVSPLIFQVDASEAAPAVLGPEDYQEGSFVPVVIGEHAQRYTGHGHYTKIGKQVTLTISISFLAEAGAVTQISNLPYIDA